MWIELSPLWLVIANVVAVPSIHLGLSWIYTRMPVSWFRPESFLFRERSWEQSGTWYQTVFRIRNWKEKMPDAAPWFDGFAKGNFQRKDEKYIERFISETCRGESAHYAQIVGLLFTLAWNPWPVAAVVMVFYSVLSNLPCIVIQRFTRARLRHLLEKQAGPKKECQGSTVSDR